MMSDYNPALPTWSLINADRPESVPLLGQFDPELQMQPGRPIWQQKPGIAGGKPWLKHVGVNQSYLTFTFLAIANTIVDPYPELAWAKLQELTRVDETLGRPPRVYFFHGVRFIEGFITDLPEAGIQYWGTNGRIVRQIGPVTVTITQLPRSKATIPTGTHFVTLTEETKYEELAALQYGDARYGMPLAVHNQGAVSGETIELPYKSNLPTTAPAAPFFDD